jgi:hypothetical protein
MTKDAEGLDPDFGPPLERFRSFDAQRHRPAAGAEGSPPVDRSFEGPAEFGDVLHGLLAHAESCGATRLAWCDPDFSGWPLGEAAWVERLTHWARAGQRELVMVASNWDAVPRLHPRFVAWRRDFAHVVQCLLPDESHTTVLPTLWIDAEGQVLRVFDAEHVRGRAGIDRTDRQHATEEFDAIAQRATPGFAAVTLGL